MVIASFSCRFGARSTDLRTGVERSVRSSLVEAPCSPCPSVSPKMPAPQRGSARAHRQVATSDGPRTLLRLWCRYGRRSRTAVPGGLQRRFSGAEVTTFAGVVAVNDQAAQPLDARPGVPETLAVGGVG